MKENRQWLYRALDFVLDNLALLVTLAVASVIIYVETFTATQLGTNDLLTAILLVLALIAISEVTERYRRLNKIEQSTAQSLALLQSQVTERPSALAFFQKLPAFDSYIQNASTLDLCGLTLTSTLNRQYSNIRERIRVGAAVRILIADPDSQALLMSALRSEEPENTDYFSSRLEATFKDIEALFRDTKRQRLGTFQVRLLPYAPSFGIYAFNSKQPNGTVIIEIHPHKSGFDSPAAFTLTALRDGQWYSYFSKQFEDMWNAAKEWQPDEPSK